MPSRLNFPGHSVSLIAKLSLQLVPGDTSRPIEGMQPFPTGDVPYADDADGSHEPRYPSDFVPYKPRVDVLLVGHFHAPHGKPVAYGLVGLQLGEHTQRLQVCGERMLRDLDQRWPPLTEAAPFTQLPLRFCHAFGGVGYAANPVGVGYALTRGQPGPLPRIELPERTLSSARAL
ncbi:MAG: DUF2169 domain-containing protein, partial [Polyangiales bacterium]